MPLAISISLIRSCSYRRSCFRLASTSVRLAVSCVWLSCLWLYDTLGAVYLSTLHFAQRYTGYIYAFCTLDAVHKQCYNTVRILLKLGVDNTAISKARHKANEKWNAKAYDEIKVRVPKGQKEVIQSAAERVGESVNAYINTAIAQRMEREK